MMTTTETAAATSWSVVVMAAVTERPDPRISRKSSGRGFRTRSTMW